MQGKQYPKPPIEEALVELRFVPGSQWDWTVPGMLRARLPSYSQPHSTQQQLTVGVSGSAMVGGTGVTRVHLSSTDKACLLGVGPDLISVHRLRPYAGWDELSARLGEALGAYVDLQAPRSVARIGLRYVNKVTFEGPPSDVGKYARISLPVPSENEASLQRVITNAQVALDSGALMAITVAATARNGDEIVTELTLDFDLTLDCSGDQSMALDDVMARIQELRAEERTAFENMVTDNARALFV